MHIDTEVVVLEVRRFQYGVVELRDDNIVVFRPDVVTFKEYNIPVLKELLKVLVEITDGIPRPYLCDNTYVTGIVGKEEQIFINEHSAKFATSTALITNSSLINVLVNSYNTYFKPKVKIRLFKTEKEAVKWLLTGY